MLFRPLTSYVFAHGLLKTALSQTTSSAVSNGASSPASSSTVSCETKLPDPVVIPFQNVTLSNGNTQRGLAISYGTPPQPFAMAINCAYNNTYILDGSGPCDSGDTLFQCLSRYGGLFDEGKSSSFHSYPNMTAPNIAPINSSGEEGNVSSATDMLTLSANVSLVDFPVGIYRGNGNHDAGPRANIFSLSSNSTALRILVAAGKIASTTFSFFPGWVGADAQHQMDGSLVLGGYDQAKIAGSNVTLPLQYDPSCREGFLVSITDMTMNLKNGTNASILGDSLGAATRACLDPGGDSMSLPVDIWNNFVNVSQSQETGRSTGPIHYWSMLVAAAGAYDGDLTVSIYPNLDIRIPNHQLVVPDYDIDSNGQTYIKNGSNREVLIYSLQDINKDDMPRLGRPFLSSAYLLADYDHSTFTLWQGKATTDKDLVAIGPPICSPPPPSATAPSSSASSGSSTSPSTKESSVSKSAVAGGIVGGLAAIALCFTFLYTQARRKQQHRKALEDKEAAARAGVLETEAEMPFYKPEMPTDRIPFFFFDISRYEFYTLAPYEVPADERHEMPSRRSTRSAREPLELPVEPRTPKRPAR